MLHLAEEQLKIRTQEVCLTPLRGIDASFEQEFKKGEISGISLFIRLPDLIIEQLTEEPDND